MRPLRLWLGLLGILAMAGLPTPVGAQPLGPEFKVSVGCCMYPYGAHLVAADASGNFIVVWSGGDVWGRRYDSTGRGLANAFRVNSYTTGNQGGFFRSPSVAAAADGYFVVVWAGQGQDDGFGVFGQRFDSAGTALGSEFRINSYTTYAQGTPSAAAAADGSFVVVWAGSDEDGDNFYGILGQRFDSAGSALGDEFRVNSTTTDFTWHPSVASDASGNFVVVWLSYGGDRYGIVGKRYDSAGVALGSEFHVGSAESTVSVASDANGNFVVVWDIDEEIYGQRYNSEGVPQGDDFLVNSYVYDYQTRPSVASDSSGNFVVAWDGHGPAGTDWGVYGRRFDSSGVGVGVDFKVFTHDAWVHDHPSVGATGTNQFVVVWESKCQYGGECGIFGRRVVNFPSLSISDLSVNEGNLPGRVSGNRVAFVVSLSAPSTETVTLAYATDNGTAKAPTDYVAKSGTLTLSPGQTSGLITVRVKEDNSVEGDETFVVNLSNPTNARLADGQGVATILNDDP